jgi:hypothetical protein
LNFHTTIFLLLELSECTLMIDHSLWITLDLVNAGKLKIEFKRNLITCFNGTHHK